MMDDQRDRSRLVDWLEEQVEADGAPTYLDAVLTTTSQTRQLASWQRSLRRLLARADHLVGRQPRLAWPVIVVVAIVGTMVVGSIWSQTRIDEGSIAYSSDEGLFLVRADGTGSRRVADGVRLYKTPWSPDGSRLLVRTSTGGLSSIAIDGNGLVDLLSGARLDVRAVSWAPDGSSIVFSAVDPTHAGLGTRLYSVRPDGTTVRPVDAGRPDEAGPIDGDDPAFSPDGDWLAFLDRASGLWVMRPDGGDRRQLGVIPSSDVIGGFGWAPDSLRLVYQRGSQDLGAAASTGIFVVGVDGTNERRISADTHLQVTPRWAPDGRRIAWLVESRDGFEIAVFDVASGQSAVLRTGVTFDGGWLDWSPDGSGLTTYTSDREQLAVISIDPAVPGTYVSSAARISGVAWRP